MELKNVRWPNLKAEAAQLLPLPSAQNAQPLPPLAEILKIKADLINGEKIFFRQAPGCSVCHQVKGKGAHIVPYLSEIGGRSRQVPVFSSILAPETRHSIML